MRDLRELNEPEAAEFDAAKSKEFSEFLREGAVTGMAYTTPLAFPESG